MRLQLSISHHTPVTCIDAESQRVPKEGRNARIDCVMVRSGRGTTAAAVVAAGGLGLSLAALGLGAATLTGALGDRTGGNKRKRGSPLSPAKWYAAQDADGRVGDAMEAVREKVREGGIEPMLRCEVWPLLLGLRARTIRPWSRSKPDGVAPRGTGRSDADARSCTSCSRGEAARRWARAARRHPRT